MKEMLVQLGKACKKMQKLLSAPFSTDKKNQVLAAVADHLVKKFQRLF